MVQIQKPRNRAARAIREALKDYYAKQIIENQHFLDFESAILDHESAISELESATSFIQDLGWPTINELIHRETSVLTHKCLNKLAPNYHSSGISKLSDLHTSELRNSTTDLLIPHMKTSYGQKSLLFVKRKSGKILIYVQN